MIGGTGLSRENDSVKLVVEDMWKELVNAQLPKQANPGKTLLHSRKTRISSHHCLKNETIRVLLG